MSLRTRFFLLTWPLVVVAVGVVAFSVDRWVNVELRRVEITGESDAVALLADRAAARWTELNGPSGNEVLREILNDIDPAAAGVVIDGNGAVLATSDPLLESSPRDDAGAAAREFVRVVDDGPRAREESVILTGAPIRTDRGIIGGLAYLLPAMDEPVPADDVRQGLRRTLWITFASASAAAALAALVLAGPLVRQIRRLSDAAIEVERGALDTRVPEGRDDELGRLERSFNAMAAALERGEIHKRNVVSDVAHELRTPLTNVRGLLEAMMDGLRAPDTDTLGALKEQTALLESLVDELQDLSLAESGQLPLHTEPLELHGEVEAALRAMEPFPPGIAIEQSSGTAVALGDRRRVRQVLTNLIDNALTHTREGGRIEIRVTETDDRVRVEISDDGPGIPDEHMELIWERFHRVDPSRQRASGGMGLGLAVVRQLVTAMGGSVGVRSRVGAGSTFEFSLPRDPDPGGTPRRS